VIAVQINGEPWQLPPETTVADVVGRLTDAPQGIAVALDGAVVPRANWPRTRVPAGGRIEVLTAAQGG